MNYEVIRFLIVAAIVLGIGLLSIVSIRKRTQELEEIAWGEASRYRREKNNG